MFAETRARLDVSLISRFEDLAMTDYQHQQMLRLLAQLLERSNEGLVPWQIVDHHSFGVETAEARVVISSRDDNDRAPYDLDLIDASGNVLDTIGSAWVDGRQSAWNENLQNLYFKAREIARDVQQVVEGFFESISFGRTVDIEPSPPYRDAIDPTSESAT
jgi:hypothetical protein